MPWEDDDLYEPWHISAHVAAIGERAVCWSKPSAVRQLYEGQTHVRRDEDRLIRFHASIAFTLEILGKSGGWPNTDRPTFDREFQERLKRICEPVDPIQFDARPSYTNRHRQSSRGENDLGWYERAEIKGVTRCGS